MLDLLWLDVCVCSKTEKQSPKDFSFKLSFEETGGLSTVLDNINTYE